MGFSTRVIHSGEEPDYGRYGDVIAPIHLSTTFARRDPQVPTGGYDYSRTSNPTRTVFEKKIAEAEGGRYGLAFSSGLAAETTLLESLLQPGDNVLLSDDLYGGTFRLFHSLLSRFGIMYDVRNINNLEDKEFKKYKLVWVETPSNPLLKVIDIKSIAGFIHDNSGTLVVDNTFASPFLQNPLSLGADVVVHSTTKYIAGHSDSLGGAIVTNNEKLFERLSFYQNAIGAVMSPFDSFLCSRGLKTLELRMIRHSENAKTIAERLNDNPKVEKVYYPGLPYNENYEVAKRQMKMFGGMVSFQYKGDINTAINKMKYFLLAESLGGVESLMEVPSLMTHSSLSKYGVPTVPANLIRLSVGIENIEDLLEDIDKF